MTASDEVRATMRVVDALERIGARYVVVGSLASSVHGEPRSTNDSDIVVELSLSQADALVADLGAEFYVSADAAREAVARAASFNAIHLETMFKVDVFVMPRDPLHLAEMDRRRRTQIGPGASPFVASAEDTVLQKLLWYRRGGGVSDRQWRDIVGVIRVQGAALDRAYLERWAEPAGLAELLARALTDAAA